MSAVSNTPYNNHLARQELPSNFLCAGPRKVLGALPDMLRSAILWLRDRVADFIPSKFLLKDCLDKGFVIFAILVHAIVFGAVLKMQLIGRLGIVHIGTQPDQLLTEICEMGLGVGKNVSVDEPAEKMSSPWRLKQGHGTA
jgi:hypothetical protein